jgi:hypothetical protein
MTFARLNRIDVYFERWGELRVYEGGHVFMVQDPGAHPDILGFLAL